MKHIWVVFLASLFSRLLLCPVRSGRNCIIHFLAFCPGLIQGHTKEGGVGEGLGTADITLCRDATSKTEKRLSMKAWHSKFHQSYLPQGTAFPSAQPLSSLALPWAPNTLPVCIFHIPLVYKRDINTFLAWHSGEIVCPRDEIILPTLSKWITVHRYQEIQATHRKKHSQGIKTRCGSWNWNWAQLVWMTGFNLHLLKAPINFGDMHQCRIPGMSMGLQGSVWLAQAARSEIKNP